MCIRDRVYPVPDVFTLIDHLRGIKPILPAAPYHSDPKNQPPLPDFADVKGQAQAKRALETVSYTHLDVYKRQL